MITYNPKDWWKLIFAFHRSDTFRILLPGMIGIAAFTALIAYIENDYLQLQIKSTTVVHSLIGFALSMLLVFRTNTAYERWWEGRRIWGSFTNNARNLAFILNSVFPKEDQANRLKYHTLIKDLFIAIKYHLRDQRPDNSNDVMAPEHINHVPNYYNKVLVDEIFKLYRAGNINAEEFKSLQPVLQTFADNLGGCERIKKTPIPYSYSIFLKKIIFLYVLTMPIGFVIDFKYWAIPIVTLVFYTFASIEIIAEEIENPFGVDANDLPIDDMCINIEKNVAEILEIRK